MHFVHGANDLTNTALDPLSKMPELKHCAVKVEKIKEA
jgi:formate dehydrogenase major subunit